MVVMEKVLKAYWFNEWMNPKCNERWKGQAWIGSQQHKALEQNEQTKMKVPNIIPEQFLQHDSFVA